MMRQRIVWLLGIGLLIASVGCGGGGGRRRPPLGEGLTRALPLAAGNAWHLHTLGGQSDDTGSPAWPISVYGPVSFHGHSAYAIEDFRERVILYVSSTSHGIRYYGRRNLADQENPDEWLVPPGYIPDDVLPREWDEQPVMIMSNAGSRYGYFVYEVPGFEDIDTPAGAFADTYAIGFGAGDDPRAVPDVLLNLAPDVGIVYVTSWGEPGVARSAGVPLQPRTATAVERMLTSAYVDGYGIGLGGGQRYNVSACFPLHDGDLRQFVGTEPWSQTVSGPMSFAGYEDVFLLDEGLQSPRAEYWRVEPGVGIQLLGQEEAAQASVRGAGQRRWLSRHAAGQRSRAPIVFTPPWELPDGIRIGEFADYLVPDQSGDIERNVLIDVATVSVPAGTFPNCLVYVASLRDPDGSEWDRLLHTYAPGIGPVRVYFPADMSGWELFYARIAGVEYGSGP